MSCFSWFLLFHPELVHRTSPAIQDHQGRREKASVLASPSSSQHGSNIPWKKALKSHLGRNVVLWASTHGWPGPMGKNQKVEYSRSSQTWSTHSGLSISQWLDLSETRRDHWPGLEGAPRVSMNSREQCYKQRQKHMLWVGVTWADSHNLWMWNPEPIGLGSLSTPAPSQLFQGL